MMKFFFCKYLLILVTSFSLNAQNDEERFLGNSFHIPSGFGLHSDVAYSSYLVEVDSSEMNSAIDYTVLESTLGVSYVYGSWMIGVYGKVLLDEVSSNMYVLSTHKKLTNHAKIDKKEFALYINYMLVQKEKSSFRVNVIYRESELDATDSYTSFNNYQSLFNYNTKGLALSFIYANKLNKKNTYFISSGVLYSKAKVIINETVNQLQQDAFIKDDSSATGIKVAFGYSYTLSRHLLFTLRSDTWWLNFSNLKVQSQVGDSLPKATLTEQSFSSYMGVTWRF